MTNLQIPTHEPDFWHRLKRRLFATPVLSVSSCKAWTLAYVWKSEVVEIVACGMAHNRIPKLPPGTQIVTDDLEAAYRRIVESEN